MQKRRERGRRSIVKKLIAAMVIIVISVTVLFAANTWQESYFTLPEPEVMQSIEEGVEPPAVAAGFDKFDILLLGIDYREDEPELGARADSIMLVTIDPDENYARVLSIPRDTRVRYLDRWRKINEIYSIDGANGCVAAVEELLQVVIDRYAVVDFRGVIALVDLMGGVVVDVPVDMYVPLENIDLNKGPEQELNGYEALAYMRYRDDILSDMDRSERQKEVLIQLTDKLLRPINILKLPTIASTALAYMQTNVSLQEVLTLARVGRTILSKGVENQVLPGINDFYRGGWYFVPFLEEIGLPMGEVEKDYLEYLLQVEEERAAQEALAKENSEEEPEGEDRSEDADGVETLSGLENPDVPDAHDAHDAPDDSDDAGPDEPGETAISDETSNQVSQE